MPDDWEGHPQRKDYPLGGVPVEYKGAEIPPPDRQEVVPVTYATERETTEGKVFTVTGGDWDTVVGGTDPLHDERIVVNMGPQHPSTHGVLRLILELEGETVTECRLVVGYLHTGIEKNLEYRNWVQGSTFVTRMDYLAPLFNETAYSLAVEKLLGIDDQITERATVIRVLMMELNRIASHLVWLGTTGLELGAISMMLYGFREREYILEIFEMVTGLRMNMAYVRPGGVAQDVPPEAIVKIREFLDDAAPQAQGVRGAAVGPADLDRAHQGRRRARRHRLPRAGHHRSGAALGRARLGPAQARCPTAATRRTSSTCRRRRPPTSGAGTRCAWPRCASR